MLTGVHQDFPVLFPQDLANSSCLHELRPRSDNSDNFRGNSLRHRKISLPVAEGFVGLLDVQRYWIVNSSADAFVFQVSDHSVPVIAADHIQVIYGARPRGFVRSAYRVITDKKAAVFSGTFPALRVPLCEVRELRVQNARLQGVQSTVVALDVMVVLLGLSVIPQHFDFSRQAGIVHCRRASFAACSEIFSWVETESGCPAHRTSFHPTVKFFGEVFRAVSLTGILNHGETILICQPEDRIHLSHLPVEVYRHNCRYRSSAAQTDEPARRISAALFLQKLLQLLD